MKKIDNHEMRFMVEALRLASKAAEVGETPVGAVVVRHSQIIGTGYNRVEIDKDPTAHAEMIALRKAARNLGDWRLSDSIVYVTLEPCIMCVSAMIHARVNRVVFGAMDYNWGGVGSLLDLSHDPRINHELQVVSGVMEKECRELLQSFFNGLRNRNCADRI